MDQSTQPIGSLIIEIHTMSPNKAYGSTLTLFLRVIGGTFM